VKDLCYVHVIEKRRADPAEFDSPTASAPCAVPQYVVRIRFTALGLAGSVDATPAIDNTAEEIVSFTAECGVPVYFSFDNDMATSYSRLLAIKKSIEDNSPYIFDQTAYLWGWVLRHPGIEDFM